MSSTPTTTNTYDPRNAVSPSRSKEVAALLAVDDWTSVKTVRLPFGPPVEQSPSGIGISVICWCNDTRILNDFLIRSFMHGTQMGSPDIELILIGPAAGCRNMGEAYNLGSGMARHANKAYLHQDVWIMDRTWADKVEVMLNAGIGAVGFIGSLTDTGGAYFHAPPWEQVTASPDLRVTPVLSSDASPVCVLDGLGLVTRSNIPWATCYERTHLFVEDYCMRLRAEGLQIWTFGSNYVHGSGGTLDATYWRSMQTFRRKWRRALPDTLMPIAAYRRFFEEVVDTGRFDFVTALRGGWEVAGTPHNTWGEYQASGA